LTRPDSSAELPWTCEATPVETPGSVLVAAWDGALKSATAAHASAASSVVERILGSCVWYACLVTRSLLRTLVW